MERRNIRFRPPRIAFNSEVRWVLARAFGPVATNLGELVAVWDSRAAIELADRLGLTARIAARQPPSLLVTELGKAGADGLRATRLAVSAADLRLDAVAEAVARVAADRGVSIAFVKGYALRLLGVVVEGGRGSADLDVLAPVEALERLQLALLEADFRPSGGSEFEHQLPALIHSSGGVVEVHRMLPGVRVGPSAARGESVTWNGLNAADLLVEAVPLPGRRPWPPECRVAQRRVLVAHLLAHAIAQHGWAPHGYPAFRMIADLIDLGVMPEEGAAEWEWVVKALGQSLHPAEAQAAGRLAQQLRDGDLSAGEANPDAEPVAALLHHLLAGAMDSEYRSSLRFRMLAEPLSDKGGVGALFSVLRHTVLPTRAEMGRIHGTTPSLIGYLGRLLWRPVDLALRAGRYALSAWRLRSR